jgi:hypothetical protein
MDHIRSASGLSLLKNFQQAFSSYYQVSQDYGWPFFMAGFRDNVLFLESSPRPQFMRRKRWSEYKKQQAHRDHAALLLYSLMVLQLRLA